MALTKIRDAGIDAPHQVPDELDGMQMCSGARPEILLQRHAENL